MGKKPIQQRDTRQRQEVLDSVMSRCDHPSADDIYIDVRSYDDKISRGTVYRNLKILTDNDEITYVRVPGSDRYDSRLDLHYHVICSECGKVIDAPFVYDLKIDKEVKSETGFEIKRHRTIFEGICPDCLAKEKETK